MAQQPIQQQYPFYPPMDNQLRYNPQLSKTEFNPKSILKKAKFCPICDFPITVRVVMQPCQHFMCYECYFIDGKTFCRFCDEMIADYKRLDDKEDFFSCDQESCYLYFDSQVEYEAHVKQHNI